MNIDFTNDTFAMLPAYLRELRFDYIRSKIDNSQLYLNNIISVGCSVNAKRVYTFKVIQIDDSIQYCTLDLINTVE